MKAAVYRARREPLRIEQAEIERAPRGRGRGPFPHERRVRQRRAHRRRFPPGVTRRRCSGRRGCRLAEAVGPGVRPSKRGAHEVIDNRLGVVTGLGDAPHTAHPKTGDTLGVLGVVGGGLSAMQGVRIADATVIIAVERSSPQRLGIAGGLVAAAARARRRARAVVSF